MYNKVYLVSPVVAERQPCRVDALPLSPPAKHIEHVQLYLEWI